ncbi:beta-amyrin 24-hydroxylase [Quercus suber]|uniref:Beta-amyrin 24-hydroxylase n=1 Tax=Quercus suber TaxID=58331 RepID=A0AAW0L9M4_QUESU
MANMTDCEYYLVCFLLLLLSSLLFHFIINKLLKLTTHPKLPPSPPALPAPFGTSGFFKAPYGNDWRFIKKLCMTELLSTGQLERS